MNVPPCVAEVLACAQKERALKEEPKDPEGEA